MMAPFRSLDMEVGAGLERVERLVDDLDQPGSEYELKNKSWSSVSRRHYVCWRTGGQRVIIGVLGVSESGGRTRVSVAPFLEDEPPDYLSALGTFNSRLLRLLSCETLPVAGGTATGLRTVAVDASPPLFLEEGVQAIH